MAVEFKERHILESVLSELDTFKTMMEACNLKLEMAESLQTRLASLENQVAELKEQNEILNKIVQELESSSKTIMQPESQNKSLEEQIQESAAFKSKRFNVKPQILRQSTQQKIRQTGHNEVRVAFTAGVSVPALANLGEHHTIIFDKVICNIGQAYHSHIGIFIAPVKGVYVFTVTLMVHARHSLYFQIVLDGHAIADVFADAGSVDVLASNTRQWVFEVNKSSEVWVRTAQAGEANGNMHTGFSGFLLYQME